MTDEEKSAAEETLADQVKKDASEAKAEIEAKEPGVQVIKIDHAKLVRERVALIRAADKVLDSVDETADDRTIQLAVISKVDGKDAIVDSERWSDDRVAGAFDGAIRAHGRTPKVDTASQIQFMTGFRGDSSRTEKLDLKSEFDSMVGRMRNAHKKPTAHQEPKRGI
jgi:hypothetical protein